MSSPFYAETVRRALIGEIDESVCVRGKKEIGWRDVDFNRQVGKDETEHHVCNIRQLVSKYKGPQDKHTRVIEC